MERSGGLVARSGGLEGGDLARQPGGLVVGDEGSAALDLARTICRRAERCVATLKDPNLEILRYLNRLSDFCWIIARAVEAGSKRL